MFNWNDLKFFLAVARQQSTIAAGKTLGVNQSTVHRRLVELEKRLQRKLVTREPAGYRLTDYAKELLPYAERIESEVKDFERHVKDKTLDLTGVIRVTCPEPIVSRLTKSALFDRFHERYPALRIEFLSSDRYLDLTKGEADIAFRSGDTDEELVGRKIADSLWAVYASKDYIARHGKPEKLEDLKQHLLVAFDVSLSNHRTSTWLKEVAPDAKIAARSNSVLGLASSIKSGVGIGPLPTAVGDAEEQLVKIMGPIPELTRSWRILTHPDLRHTPRISAFFDFIVEQRALMKPIFTG